MRVNGANGHMRGLINVVRNVLCAYTEFVRDMIARHPFALSSVGMFRLELDDDECCV